MVVTGLSVNVVTERHTDQGFPPLLLLASSQGLRLQIVNYQIDICF